jgi:inositol oxygenase
MHQAGLLLNIRFLKCNN